MNKTSVKFVFKGYPKSNCCNEIVKKILDSLTLRTFHYECPKCNAYLDESEVTRKES